MKKYFYNKTLKVALSATIAIIIANKFGLKFAVTAGIISILSIQNTKKEALLIAGKRIVAVSIGILLSFVLYIILGNSPIIFGMFLLIFIPITKFLKVEDGMVVSAVLSTHLLSSSNIDLTWVINEFGLTIIGVGVALIFNLYSQSLEELFEKNKKDIEEKYKIILLGMADSLITQSVPIDEKELLDQVEELLKYSKQIALQINNNYIFKHKSNEIDYIDMRIMQMDSIKRMKRHFYRFYMRYQQTIILSEFTKNVALNIREDNDCVIQIENLYELREEYKRMELPKTRDEFENRALLFQFLNDLEDFLMIKKRYKQSLNKSTVN